MASINIQTAMNAGEMSPSLFGRVDLDKYKKACSTLRNFFASYRGGASSRAGLKFVGQCKQTASVGSTAPQLIPFQFSSTQGIMIEAGDQYFRFVQDGAYITETPVSITGITKANPGVVQITNSWSNGDWVYLTGIGGMTRLNGRIYIVANRTGVTITLVDTMTGNGIDTSAMDAWTSGGTAARIYTLSTPYAIADVQALKWTQSADVMSIVHPTYPPYDLARVSSANWTLTKTSFVTSILRPDSCTASASSAGSFHYQYLATAVSDTSGEESTASPIANVTSVNIASVAGSITIQCGAVTGASSYNWYRAPESYNTVSIAGAIFGYLGTSFGPTFLDSNITPDYTTSPPIHYNPFATGSVTAIRMSSYGTGYDPNTASIIITSATGSGFAGYPVLVNGGIQWCVIQNGGENYSSSDTVSFNGGGSGAAATASVGRSTGTYPSVVAYFQQRRFYANSTNQPDTYWASQPGAFKNMDSAIPTNATDAIEGAPWSQQVNGIQWLVNMPGGLVVLTGLGAWQLSGQSGGGAATAAAITPSNQVANPQAYNGVDALLRPITINYDILYVQAKGSVVRDLSYNFFVNIYTGTDMTVMSNHLFDGHTITRWDWAEEPYKLVWCVRDDGIMLCLTFLKEQDVYSWSRHDTNGLFCSVGVISEPPVNATYVVVKRYIQNFGSPKWVYYLERMDDRIWQNIDDVWCVDAGLAYPLSTPSATLTVNSYSGVNTIQQPTIVYGGSNYSTSTYARIDDLTGSGTGATASLSISSGVIVSASVSGTLTGYSSPKFVIVDPTLSGGNASINITTSNVATVTATPGVFSNTAGSGAAGDVLHIGAGKMSVTSYSSSTQLIVNVTRPITKIFRNDPLNTVVPATSGNWTIGAPITTVYGLNHLEGMTCSILADGNIITPQQVTNGSISLSQSATQIVVGLGYTCQLQTMYLEAPSQVTVQGRRKSIDDVVLRLEASAGPFQVGTNEPDASVQPGQQDVAWTNLTPVNPPYPNQTPNQPFSLYTGDIFTPVTDQQGFDRGQIAVQQSNPIPLNILAIMPWFQVDDNPGP